jgi:pimeloyl-ACP methyl ester carboxylesterase
MTPPARLPSAIDMTPLTIGGDYLGGQLHDVEVGDRKGYVILPTTPATDAERRWVWIVPYWLGVADRAGVVEHRFYVEAALARGYAVAGVNVGTTFGSPAGADVFQSFYERVVDEYGLHPRTRMILQSNGGLIGYGWAFRHPECVDRIFGICPVTDFFTWPPSGLQQIVDQAEPGLGYGLTASDLSDQAADLNPIDNLAPLAEAGVRIFHIHGNLDDIVPLDRNTEELIRRYQQFGGDASVGLLPGVAHGGYILFESVAAMQFLLDD